MFRVLFLMLVLLAGLIAGPYIAGNQGYVRIETVNTVIEMSIVMLVVIFVVSLALIYTLETLLRKLWRWSRNAYNWAGNRKHKKAQQQTLEGLMQMSEGNYAKAEKLIGKNAKHSAEPILNLIKAAEAAQQNNDDFGANKYLIEASKLAGNNNVAVELARTRILILQNKLPAARSAVDSLRELAPNNEEVARLAISIYQQSKAYKALDVLLEDVGQRSFLTEEEFENLEHFVDDGLLDEILHEEGQEGLLNWWDKQTSRRRKSVYSRTALIARLIDSDDHDSAAEIALETVKKFEDEQLCKFLPILTRLQVPEDSKLLKVLDKRAQKAEEEYSDDYARALGYMYTREGLFAKAKPYFVQVIHHRQCSAQDRIMALHMAEQLHDNELIQLIRTRNLQEVNLEKTPEAISA